MNNVQYYKKQAFPARIHPPEMESHRFYHELRLAVEKYLKQAGYTRYARPSFWVKLLLLTGLTGGAYTSLLTSTSSTAPFTSFLVNHFRFLRQMARQG